MKRKFLGVAAALSLLAAMSSAAPALASTVVFSLSPTSGVLGNQPAGDIQPLDLGMNFTVNSSVTVNSLGAFTNGSSDIVVRLYDLTTPSLVATTTVGSPVGSSNYAFNSIGPVILTPGLYQINAFYNSTSNVDFNPYESGGSAASVVFNSLGGKLSFSNGDYYTLGGNGLSVASTHDLPSPNGYGAGTFTVTPLPSTWLMLLSGFVGLGFFAYRGTKKRTALSAA